MFDKSDIKRFILDLFFPNRCPLCGKVINWNTDTCGKCLDELPYTGDELCKGCGYNINSCECNDSDFCFLRCYAAFYYKKSGKGGVVYLKNTKNELFPRLFAEKVASDIYGDCFGFNADCIVPVPMTKTKLIKRGYNQAEVLADALASELNIPIVTDAIYKKVSFVAQHNLSASERRKNAFNIFYEGNADSVKGKRVIIVDDVITTGSTVNSCAKILINMGAKAVAVAAAATV